MVRLIRTNLTLSLSTLSEKLFAKLIWVGYVGLFKFSNNFHFRLRGKILTLFGNTVSGKLILLYLKSDCVRL